MMEIQMVTFVIRDGDFILILNHLAIAFLGLEEVIIYWLAVWAENSLLGSFLGVS